jgi:hypothetical protein
MWGGSGPERGNMEADGRFDRGSTRVARPRDARPAPFGKNPLGADPLRWSGPKSLRPRNRPTTPCNDLPGRKLC